MVKGCPLISREVGLRLLDRYEECVKKGKGVSKLDVNALPDGPREGAVRTWLRDQIRKGEGVLDDTTQLMLLRSLFPKLPLRWLARACVSSACPQDTTWSAFPWNRRVRRSLDRGGLGSVLLTCTSGAQGWKSSGRVLKVSGTEKGLGSAVVFSHLLRWALSGVFGGLVFGPGRPEGHKLLERSGRVGEGSEGLSEGFSEGLLAGLRFVLLVGVSQAVKDAEGWSESSSTGLDRVELPEGLKDPMEVVEWALTRAAEKLNQIPSESRMPETIQPKPVFVLWEPPKGFKGSAGLGVGGLIGDELDTTSWQELYGFQMLEFDKGCFGALGKGRARWLTSSWFLFEALQGHWLPGKVTRDEVDSEFWPGALLRVVQTAWDHWKLEVARAEEIKERKVLLAKLSEKERFEKHVLADHVPYMKGCPVCIQAQGRRRAHWRSSFPAIHSASMDIAGPFVPGQSFDPVASGRDRGGVIGISWPAPTRSLKGTSL